MFAKTIAFRVGGIGWAQVLLDGLGLFRANQLQNWALGF
jgi:hypothetical protein